MIELTSAILLLASSFSAPALAQAKGTVPSEPQKPASLVEELHAEHPMTLDKYVREYFKETPLLADIAFCESTMRHQHPDGEVVRGKVNSDDVGVMQINEYYHLKTAQKLGIDLHSLEGNMSYAKLLYEKQGPQPWISSSKCWKKSPHYHPELLAKR
jgi:hypothetical protein